MALTSQDTQAVAKAGIDGGLDTRQAADVITQANNAPTAPVNSIPADALGQSKGTFSTYFPPPSASANLAESAIASKDSYIARAAAETDALATEQTKGKGLISSAFAQLSGQATKKADLYESSGLNTDKKAIDELTGQIEGRTRAYDKQIKDIQENNPEGKLASGIVNEVNRVSGQKASELADLAIVLNAKTRNFDTAKSIIDQKADAETEDLRTKLAGLEFFFSNNESKLDKNQTILMQQKISAAQDELDAKKTVRTQIGNVQLEAAKNGAPVSVVRAIGAAQDLEGALGHAGGYLKTKTGGASFDAYTDTEARTVTRANLQGASSQAKAAFLSTPPAFQDAFIRNGTGLDYPKPTPQNIIKSLADWEKEQKAASADTSVEDLANKISGGK